MEHSENNAHTYTQLIFFYKGNKDTYQKKKKALTNGAGKLGNLGIHIKNEI